MAIELDVGSVQPVDFDVGDADSLLWDMDEYIRMVTESLPEYDGAYEVTPKLAAQVLATRGKAMVEDVTVDEIPSYRVTNPSGGYTVVIAQG